MKHYTIVIFGGTGDLSKRKLFPAIKSLAEKKEDIKINVFGVGRKEYTSEEYKNFVLPEEKIPHNLKINYFNADIEKKDSLKGLRAALEKEEPEEIEGRIYYLATSHLLFKNIVQSIHSCCGKKEKGFTRIIAEKPFGTDIISSRKLNRVLKKYFSEEQIYRADHYLAKETVDNILRLRLSNPLFERMWNGEAISRIKMTVDEELGVGNRVLYYDRAGAVKDMIQNHLLQTLSFILMAPPKSLEEKDFRKAKVAALKKLQFKNEIITGQYKEYREEAEKHSPDSKTETFAELKLYSKDKRWKGTEIILRTGKKLKKREAHIEIEFKKEPCTIHCHLNTAPNKLILHIQPLDNVELLINTTLPGEKESLSPVKMTFCKSCEFKANSPEGYETIIKECMLGNKRIFIGDKELEAAWKITDKITESIKNKTPEIYESGSAGPEWKA